MKMSGEKDLSVNAQLGLAALTSDAAEFLALPDDERAKQLESMHAEVMAPLDDFDPFSLN
ncbi:hypothetical protein LH460_06285 [Laribacter hongkongensis]|uniref:hypothetical protein n=1 Tax=Laribacter hongkongensis TaxID=168471 RepID=UPI001EFD2C97|nr:hypothetical protein [Laribacter hongkongensis]MCG9124279.1 hypothetical protein [Laribacter hongkongensis]